MVNEEMVETIVHRLAPEGRVFVQTDIEFLADEMFGLFRSRRELSEVEITENPFSVRTEREKAVEDKGLAVYRSEWLKTPPI